MTQDNNPNTNVKRIYLKRSIIIIAGALLFMLINIINFSIKIPVFNSADEMSNYIITKEYGTRGRMYLTGKYLDIDHGNHLHPRGLITHNNKLVPFNFLGVPFFYGTFYTILGDYIKYINIVFFAIFVITVHKIIALIENKKKENGRLVPISLIGLSPILYFMNLSYFNIIPVISFGSIGIYFIMKFHKNNRISELYLSFFFLIILIWHRYEYIIFVGLFFLISMVNSFKIYKEVILKPLHVLALGCLGITTFVIPLMILNHSIYGNYLTYGYALFTKTYFLEERGGSTFQSVFNILLPGLNFDIPILLANIEKNLFLMSPIAFLLAYIGYIKNGLRKRLGRYNALIIYLIIYQGMSPTFGSGLSNVWFGAIVRYRILVYIICIISYVLYIQRNGLVRSSQLLIIFIVIALNMNIFYEGITKEKNTRESFANQISYIDSLGISGDYIITPIDDKYLYLNNNIISRWGGTVDGLYHFNKTKGQLAKTLIYLLKKGENIYAQYNKTRFSTYYLEELKKLGVGSKSLGKNIYKFFVLQPASTK